MEIQEDFRELLELLNAHKVRYMIVGGYALAFHGAPRYTGDLDIWVQPDAVNAGSVLKALDAFGFGGLALTEEDFTKPDHIVQLGYPPVRVDIITSISGVSWQEAYDGSANGDYGGIPVNYIGRVQYIQNKKASGRKKDFADIEALGED